MKNQKAIWDREYLENANKWKKETKSMPEIIEGKRVLELGVGNGKTLGAILKQNPSEVFAIDFSKEAVKQAERKYPEVNFLVSDISDIPLEDESFDVIVCYYVLNNLSDKDRRKAVSEMYRLVSPGGKIVFEDFAVGDFREKEEEEHSIVNKKGIYCHFFSNAELKRLFKKFSESSFKVRSFLPVTHKKLIRKIISGIIVK